MISVFLREAMGMNFLLFLSRLGIRSKNRDTRQGLLSFFHRGMSSHCTKLVDALSMTLCAILFRVGVLMGSM